MNPGDSESTPDPASRPPRTIRLLHEYPKKEPPGWFQRNQVIASFFLTSIIGGAVTFAYQSIAASIEKEREVRVAQRAATRDFLPKLVDAAERRNYFAFRIISDLDELQQGRQVDLVRKLLEEDRVKYRAAVEAWNLQRHFYERFLEVYASSGLRKRFYETGQKDSVVVQFQRLHAIIQRELIDYEQGRTISAQDIAETRKLREELSGNLAQIYDELLRRSTDE